jgi:PHD/YefM family antitoxin component YafN of YafNO toxin-antitoxin module
MIETMEIAKAKRDLPRIVRGLKKSGSLAISNRGRTVAYLISRDRVEAMLETLEIMGNPKARKAIRDYEAGKTRFRTAEALAGCPALRRLIGFSH